MACGMRSIHAKRTDPNLRCNALVHIISVKTISALLQRNWLPFTVTCKEEALDEIGKGDFDLVVAQLEPEDTVALECLDDVLVRRSDLPVIVVSDQYVREDIEAQTRAISAIISLRGGPGELQAALDSVIEEIIARGKV